MSKLASRRQFLCTAAVTAGTLALAGRAGAEEPKLHVACNQYPWVVYYRREGRDFAASLEEGLGELAASGLDGYEPLVTAPAQIDQVAPLLAKSGLEMRSLYVNSTLHEPAQADGSIAEVLAIAAKAKALGTRIVVTNPSPIRWGGPEDKNDAQLRTQAASLERLGKELRALDMVLAYHNHDAELRAAAREFHHMLAGTDPQWVTLCLDAHWIYRGAGNSQVALFDAVKLYGSRITEVHLRQSRQNVWSETLTDGDIDYPALATSLAELGLHPHVVLEQAVEDGTPKSMTTVEAFRQSAAYARKVFGRLAS